MRIGELQMRALLISTYELGRQPFGLASPAAWLRREGWEVTCVDLAKERLTDTVVRGASLVGFHLPMHTATRLAASAIQRVRDVNPAAQLCAYGLYAPLNREWLQSIGVPLVLGGEFEESLAAVARHIADRSSNLLSSRATEASAPGPATDPMPAASLAIPRLKFLVPDRRGLPPLERYAFLQMPDGTRRVVGSTEASRGCKHLCRHCPVVPVYNGQFRIVQPDVVLADIAAQVAAGAQHITFGDPDFLNGPTHALRVVERLHDAWPTVTYDVTVKIQHLLQQADVLPRLRETGCLFVTSAVESIDDAVLVHLDKGHTRADFLEAVATCRSIGLTLVPTFVAFHPWATLSGYCDLLDTIANLDLVDNVAPIQLAIRLLIPEGSKLLELDEIGALVAGFDRATLTYQWSHSDPRVDELHRDVSVLVGSHVAGNRRRVFEEIQALAHERAAIPLAASPALARGERSLVPFLSEPWYCCAEPNPEQLRLV